MVRPRHPDGVVSSFGLYWDRYSLECGTRGPNGASRMLGYAYGYAVFEKQMLNANRPGARGLLRDPFPPVIDHRGQAGVYALYDEEFNLLYVGQSGGDTGGGTIHARLLAHHRNSTTDRTGQFFRRWRWFSWFGLQAPSNLAIQDWYRRWDATAELEIAQRKLDRLQLSAETFAAELPGRGSALKGIQTLVIDQLEALLITIAEPPYNKQGPQWQGAVEYLQAADNEGFDSAAADGPYAFRYWLGPRSGDWGSWGVNPNDVLK